jgi:hypothetical protein
MRKAMLKLMGILLHEASAMLVFLVSEACKPADPARRWAAPGPDRPAWLRPLMAYQPARPRRPI